MTDSSDPLEAELRALQPHGVSAGTRDRISARLGGSSNLWWLKHAAVFTAGAIAAALVAGVLLVRRDSTPDAAHRDRPPEPGSRPVVALRADSPPPTLQVYSRALAGSRDQLNALFDQHARLGVQPDADDVSVFAFTRSGDGLHPLAGDL